MSRRMMQKSGGDDDDDPQQQDDRHRRPSVYEEAMEMLTGSLVIYLFAEIRQMAREQQQQQQQQDEQGSSSSSSSGACSTTLLQQLPITKDDVLEHLKSNRQALEERAVAIDHEALRHRLEAVRHIVQESSQTDISVLGNLLLSSSASNSPAKEQELSSSSIRLTHFGDENSDREFVHAIVVNPVRQRITVVFRGSVTQQDFIQDAKCVQKKVPNPVHHHHHHSNSRNGDHPEKEECGGTTTETINVHTGFYEYLWKQDQTTGKTRLATILDDVKDLLRQYPGFSLFCTGHSLGGALATLCGFYAAADDELCSLVRTTTMTTPVVVYSVASPLCGNWKFRRAFVHLERCGRLQHLRIANADDMVTLLPFFAPKATIVSPALSLLLKNSGGAGNLYQHVGIRLQLSSSSSSSKESNGSSSSSNSSIDAGSVKHTLLYPNKKDQNNSGDDKEYNGKVRGSLSSSGKTLAKAFHLIIKNDFAAVQSFHSCEQYEARLERCKADLMRVTLDDLYRDKAIVGNALDDESVSKKSTSVLAKRSKRIGFWTNKRSSSSKVDNTTS